MKDKNMVTYSIEMSSGDPIIIDADINEIGYYLYTESLTGKFKIIIYMENPPETNDILYQAYLEKFVEQDGISIARKPKSISIHINGYEHANYNFDILSDIMYYKKRPDDDVHVCRLEFEIRRQ